MYYDYKATKALTSEQVDTLNNYVKRWTSGEISTKYLEDELLIYSQEIGMDIVSAGGNFRCIYKSIDDVPTNLVSDSKGAYYFCGIYTKGKYDANGYLICYIWELLVR